MKTFFSQIVTADEKFLHFLENNFCSLRLMKFFRFYTHLGDAVVHIPVGIFLVITGSSNLRLLALRWLMATFLGALVLYPLRITVKRVRPRGNLPGGYLPLPEFDRYSFPSGHALRNFLIPFIFFAPSSPFFWLLFFFALTVSFSRLYLQYHFLSDVITGAVIGMIIGIIFTYTGPGAVYS